MTINAEHAEDMYRFITSIVKRNECFLCRIGGIENHIHMLIDLAPTVRRVVSSLNLWVGGRNMALFLFPLPIVMR